MAVFVFFGRIVRIWMGLYGYGHLDEVVLYGKLVELKGLLSKVGM